MKIRNSFNEKQTYLPCVISKEEQAKEYLIDGEYQRFILKESEDVIIILDAYKDRQGNYFSNVYNTLHRKKVQE